MTITASTDIATIPIEEANLAVEIFSDNYRATPIWDDLCYENFGEILTNAREIEHYLWKRGEYARFLAENTKVLDPEPGDGDDDKAYGHYRDDLDDILGSLETDEMEN